MNISYDISIYFWTFRSLLHLVDNLERLLVYSAKRETMEQLLLTYYILKSVKSSAGIEVLEDINGGDNYGR